MAIAFTETHHRIRTIRKPALSLLFAAVLAALFAFPAFPQEEPDGAAEAVELFSHAQDLHEKGDLKGAIELYRELLAIFPDLPEAEYQLGSALRSTGDREGAESAFRRAVELREDWSLALAALGGILTERSAFDEAKPMLKKAIELDAQNFPALSALVDLSVRTKVSNAELKSLLAAVTELTSGKANPPASAWIARGLLERTLNLPADADRSLSLALRIDPNNIRAKYEKAETALARKDPSTAKGFANEIAAIEPDTRELRMLRANILLSEGNNAAALKILNDLSDPTSEALQLRDRVRMLSTEDPLELERSLADDANNVEVIGRLCSLFRTKDAEKALEYCRRASELEPNNISHAIGFGAALVRSKRYPEAAGLLRKLLEFAPDNYTARANLATALFLQNDFAGAKAEYRTLIDAQPNTPIAYYFLAICHDRLQEYLDAMANYQAFLRQADPAVSALEIDKTNLRLPVLQEQIKRNGGKRK